MSKQMSSESAAGPDVSSRALRVPRRRAIRLLLLVTGILIGQAVLYGPSLCGRKVLLPLDVLAEGATYLPAPEQRKVKVRNTLLSDLVLLFEPARRFAVSEVQSGRLPSWAPYQYCGTPFIWPKFSPFLAPQMFVASPIILSWTQLLAALVAGLGAYGCFRRVLAVSFWPATIGAWCYPLTGFFIFWVGYPTGLAVYWLPWILLTVEATVRRPGSVAPIGLGAVTCLSLVSGHLDVAGQVLVVSGLFAACCVWNTYGKAWFRQQAAKAGLALLLAWSAGFLVAAPYVLPAVEYSKTGARMERRSAGEEERPPIGLSALPQVVLPDMYGRHVTFAGGSQAESSAAGYVGVVATFLTAPLAFCSRRHRRTSLWLTGLALFSLSWCLNIPGFVHLLRLPPLNLMSHNRLVFAAAFSVLGLAVIGLEVLAEGAVRWRRWFRAPVTLLALLLAWCVYSSVFLPEPLESELASFVMQGKSYAWIRDLAGVHEVQRAFTRSYLLAAGWCGVALAGWWFLWRRRLQPRALVPAVGAVLVLELLSFGFGRPAQTDPALYYPPVPVLKQLAESQPGRVIGFCCFPANLAGACGLNDIRGYDGVDPARLTELLMTGARPDSPRPMYALTQYLVPNVTDTADRGLVLPPVLDLLGIQYVILRGAPPADAQPAFTSSDYWVFRNPAALPRAFVPRRVEAAPDATARLAKLAATDFDPREIAYAETPVNLPENCQGTVRIVREIPTAMDLSVEMATPGLVVLADRWDPGWTAALNGAPAPILRVNHALRGVVMPAGAANLQFRYQPTSFTTGLKLAGAGGLILLVWMVLATSVAHRRCPGDTRGSRPQSDAGR